jgi:hypothetical protein
MAATSQKQKKIKTGATTPRERFPKRREKATCDDGGLFQSETAEAQRGEATE